MTLFAFTGPSPLFGSFCGEFFLLGLFRCFIGKVYLGERIKLNLGLCGSSFDVFHRETLHLHSSEVEEDKGHGQVVEEEAAGRERR